MSSLEIVLNKVGLGHLEERFKAEKVDVDTLSSASDQELNRLGVTTIGDRVRLKECCRNFRKEYEEGQ